MTNHLIRITVLGLALCSISMSGCTQTGDNPFLGRWALFLPGGAGWLEIRQEQGYLDGDILWYGGSVLPVSGVLMKGDTLVVTRNRDRVVKRDADGNPLRTLTYTGWIECVLEDGEMDVVGS